MDRSTLAKCFMNHKNKILWKSFLILSCGALLLMFALGCASVKYSLISKAQDNDKNTTGLRYYDTSEYLLMQHDPNDPSGTNWISQVYFANDQTKMRQAEITCILSVNTSSFTFTNGTLTDTSVSTDSTTVPVAVVNAIATAIGAGLGHGITPFSLTSGINHHKSSNFPQADVQLFKFVAGLDPSGKTEAYGVVAAGVSSTDQ